MATTKLARWYDRTMTQITGIGESSTIANPKIDKDRAVLRVTLYRKNRGAIVVDTRFKELKLGKAEHLASLAMEAGRRIEQEVQADASGKE